MAASKKLAKKNIIKIKTENINNKKYVGNNAGIDEYFLVQQHAHAKRKLERNNLCRTSSLTLSTFCRTKCLAA